MLVIPAIDLKAGRCVRLSQGRMDRETVYSDDPAATARQWARAGARLLHVVDLDGAVAGAPRNLEALRRILEAVPVPVQAGGGIRRLDTLERLLALGVARVVLGTSVLEDRAFLEEACRCFPGRVVVGIDARDGRVAVRGWTETTSARAVDVAREVARLPIRAIVYTDIQRDGMLSGPNVASLEALLRAVPVPVIASGGVASLDHLRTLRKLDPAPEGVIVGRALYAGTLDLREAIAAAEEGA